MAKRDQTSLHRRKQENAFLNRALHLEPSWEKQQGGDTEVSSKKKKRPDDPLVGGISGGTASYCLGGAEDKRPEGDNPAEMVK